MTEGCSAKTRGDSIDTVIKAKVDSESFDGGNLGIRPAHCPIPEASFFVWEIKGMAGHHSSFLTNGETQF